MGDHPRKADWRRVLSPQFKRTQVLVQHLSRAAGSPWVTIMSTWRRRSSAGRPGGARTGPRPSGTHWRGSSPRRRRGRTQSREEGNADYERLRDASHEVDGQPHTIPGGTSRRALQVGATGSCMHRLLDAPACEGPRWARLMRTVCAARRSRGRVVHPGVILAFTRLQSVALATPPETLYLPGVHDGGDYDSVILPQALALSALLDVPAPQLARLSVGSGRIDRGRYARLLAPSRRSPGRARPRRSAKERQ